MSSNKPHCGKIIRIITGRFTAVLLSAILVSVMMFSAGCEKGETTSQADGASSGATEASGAAATDQASSNSAGTDGTDGADIKIKVVVPTGVPILSIIRMAYEKPAIMEGFNVEYEITQATDVLNSRLVSGEAGISVIPVNLAAQLYNKGVEYRLAVPSIWGIYYLVSSEELSGWEDLKGKEIYTIGRGLTSDITMRYLLSSHGIDPDKDVTLVYLSGASELAPAFISGKSTVSLMPEPMLSTVMAKKTGTYIAIDFQEAWAEATGLGSSYPQAALVIKKELAEKYPEFVGKFINEYKNSIEWLYAEPQKAGEYAVALNTGIAAEIVPAALPRMNIKFETAWDSRDAVKEYLDVILESSPEMIGGKIPDEAFYYRLEE